MSESAKKSQQRTGQVRAIWRGLSVSVGSLGGFALARAGLLERQEASGEPVKIGGVYILTRRSIARMLATITAALMMFYAAATAQAEDMVRRIHDATIALVSLDRQMIGRLAYVVVPDFMYLEYRSLYLELKPFRDFHGRVPPIVREPVASGAAVAGRPPYPAARRDASPHHAAVTVDDLQRAVEEVKRTVRKAKREIIEDAHPAHEAERRRESTG